MIAVPINTEPPPDCAWQRHNQTGECSLFFSTAYFASTRHGRSRLGVLGGIMAGSDRALGALKLFTIERPDWTVEKIATAMGVSASSAYRYVAALEKAGLLTTVANGRYTLGPAVIEYDRQIQLTDPLLQAAQPVVAVLVQQATPGSIVLLCRLFRDTVLCVHQASDSADHDRNGIAYQRGRPMPLFRGATSKAILAHMAGRELHQLYRRRQIEIGEAGLGSDWATFRSALAPLRKNGYVVTHAELDAGRIGIAAPIRDASRRVIGSLSYVVHEGSSDDVIAQFGSGVSNGAKEIEATMRAYAEQPA